MRKCTIMLLYTIQQVQIPWSTLDYYIYHPKNSIIYDIRLLTSRHHSAAGRCCRLEDPVHNLVRMILAVVQEDIAGRHHILEAAAKLNRDQTRLCREVGEPSQVERVQMS